MDTEVDRGTYQPTVDGKSNFIVIIIIIIIIIIRKETHYFTFVRKSFMANISIYLYSNLFNIK